MKVLLINPRNVKSYSGHSPHPPLGLLYIAAYVREREFKDIKILDCVVDAISNEVLRQEIANADIIGTGGFTSQFKHAIEISKICKELNKFSVCGGLHVSAIPEECLKISNFDVAVKGEGEKAFYELLKVYNSGSKDFSEIQGLVYRSDGKIIENENRISLEDLNHLPFPARDLLPMEKYRTRDEFFSSFYTIIQSSRGCPHECVFCNSPKMWGRKIRIRSGESIFSEMSELHDKFGFKCFHISDDGFTYRKQAVVDTSRLIIKSRMNIEWACVSRPELLDLELLGLMKESGCIRISIGVESADPEILNRAKKKYNLKKIEESAELIKKAGILLHCYMMSGLPGDNVRAYWRSIKFMRKLKPDRIGWAVVTPYPGSELYDNNLIEITDKNYLDWGGYMNPVVKVGRLSPLTLRFLQLLANYLTGKKYQGRNIIIVLVSALTFHLPLCLIRSFSLRMRRMSRNLMCSSNFKCIKNMNTNKVCNYGRY